jgi:hypothetical protein
LVKGVNGDVLLKGDTNTSLNTYYSNDYTLLSTVTNENINFIKTIRVSRLASILFDFTDLGYSNFLEYQNINYVNRNKGIKQSVQLPIKIKIYEIVKLLGLFIINILMVNTKKLAFLLLYIKVRQKIVITETAALFDLLI